MNYPRKLVIRLRQPDSVEKALSNITEKKFFKHISFEKNRNLESPVYKSQPRINQNFIQQYQSVRAQPVHQIYAV